MQTRFSPARCCCDAPPPDDPCPCFEDTLEPFNDMEFTGITNLGAHADMNQTIGDAPYAWTNQLGGCGAFSQFGSGGFSGIYQRWSFGFTRAEVIGVGETEYVMPVGVKLVVHIEQWSVSGPGIFRADSHSFASFYKLLADVDGSVDCSAGVSLFTFVAQGDNGQPTFDASGATIEYVGD